MAKGIYTPRNPSKYLGDPRKIRFLSSWELKFMNFCDTNPNILAWGSEELKIQYWHPIKKKICTYLPDFLIKYKNSKDVLITEVVEIKPLKQAKPGKRVSTYDQIQLIINDAKWRAAQAFCEKHGIKFRVVTERDLFR